MDKDKLYMLPLKEYLNDRLKLTEDALSLLISSPENVQLIIIMWEKQWFEYHALRKGAVKKTGDRFSPLL